MVATFIGNGLQSASVGRLEQREFRAQQKSCGRELFMTACDSCFFAKKENNLMERHRWQFLTSDPRFKKYMSPQCQGNHEHVWKQTSEGKRENPSASYFILISRSFCCFICSRNREGYFSSGT